MAPPSHIQHIGSPTTTLPHTEASKCLIKLHGITWFLVHTHTTVNDFLSHLYKLKFIVHPVY